MIVGIDLGTTNSLISVWRNGQAELISNALGDVLTPSCVSVDEDGSILVGRAARERLQTHPGRTASVFKRSMGTSRTFTLAQRAFRPEELSALVLKSLKDDAQAVLGQAVTEAVITVPAYFSEAQRKATRVAGELAGLRVERLLNEPTAAALAYGIHELGDESRFLVFDLGGGTFDVSILELFDGVMEVRATAGDNFLGGEDFTRVLLDLFVKHHGWPADWLEDAALLQRLLAQAETAKHQLGTHGEARMTAVRAGQDCEFTLQEPEFEKACASLLQRLRTPIERALRDARLKGSELDKIVLAGGATRMPMVRRLVTLMFGRFPSGNIHPDEVVARGAAVQAGLKARDASLKEVVMTDVCPYSLGVSVVKQVSEHVTSSGHFDPVIERNTVVPVSRIKRYFPMHPQQTEIELNIFQGEARMAKDNIPLGQLHVPLPTARNGENAVDVRFTYDVNGLLQVEAKPAEADETFSLLIESHAGTLSEAEIARSLAVLADLKIHPRDRIENRTLLAHAERLYQQLRGEVREWLGVQILRFEQALATQDPRPVLRHRKHFGEMLSALERDGILNPDLGDPL